MSVNDCIIVVAMDKEAERIKTKKEIIVTGIGGINTVQTLFKRKDDLKDKLIINVGYAGSSVYDIGTVVSINKAKKYERSNAIEYPEYNLYSYSFTENTCYTADNFIQNTNDKIIPVIDMELYYIKSLFKNTISLKLISDNMNMQQYEDNVLLLDKGWKEINMLLKEIIYE